MHKNEERDEDRDVVEMLRPIKQITVALELKMIVYMLYYTT